MRLLHILEMKEPLAPGEVPRYRFLKTFEEAKDDPFLVLHTSGSTGLQKPIHIAQSWFCGPDSQHNLPLCNGHAPAILSFRDGKVFCCLPPFHVSCPCGAYSIAVFSTDPAQAANLIASLITTVMYNAVSIWPPSSRPMNTLLVESMLDAITIDVLVAAPSILGELSQSDAGMEGISKLKAAAFGGGKSDLFLTCTYDCSQRLTHCAKDHSPAMQVTSCA